MLKNLGLVFASLVMALALCEVMLRALGRDLLPEPDLYELDPDIGKRMRPGWEGGEFGARIKINSKGLRSPEVAYERTGDAIRILALGDSWTFGYRLPESSSYPRQLERMLNADGTGPGHEVINAGVVGYSTEQEAAYLRVEGRRFRPDLVVVGYYPVNDTHAKKAGYDRYNRLNAVHPWLLAIYKLPRQLVLREFIRGVRKLAKRRFAEARIALAGTLGYSDDSAQAIVEDDWTVNYREGGREWENTAAAIREIGALTREMGVPGLLVMLPDSLELTRYHERYHPKAAPLVRAAAESADLVFFDLEPAFRPWRGREAEILFPGERHPNEHGYQIIARAVAGRISALRGASLGTPAAAAENTPQAGG